MNFDLWRPSASIETLKRRAVILAKIRQFFCDRGYLEVATPMMAHHGVTDVHLKNITAQFRGQEYYLQTSPEYHMKRLLAAGSGPIFQLATVFRDDELGRWHNPEFTLLEWYRPEINHHQLMDEMAEFLNHFLQTRTLLRKTYQAAFIEAVGFCPLTSSIQTMQIAAQEHGVGEVFPQDHQEKDDYLYLLMSHVVEPYLNTLNVPVAVYDFPASQASLAQSNGVTAARFEIYYHGVELANGFYELTCPVRQKERLKEDNQKRASLGYPEMKIDGLLIDALSHGLPECSGVALGVERLLALIFQESGIAQTMAFPFDRA